MQWSMPSVVDIAPKPPGIGDIGIPVGFRQGRKHHSRLGEKAGSTGLGPTRKDLRIKKIVMFDYVIEKRRKIT